MKTQHKIGIALVSLAAAALVAMYLMRRSPNDMHAGHAHHGGKELQTGITSFDVYSDDRSVHLLTLTNHAMAGGAMHQLLRYERQTQGRIVITSDVPTAAERIISKRSNDVQLAAQGERVLAVWQVAGTGFGGRGPMRFAESNDAGKTWRIISGATAAERTDDQGFFDIAADATHGFHLVWLDAVGKGKGLRYARYSTGAWQKTQTIDNVTCQCCYNSLRLNARGEPIVLYRRAAPRDMAFATLTQQGWQTGESVDNFGWQVNACPHAGGGLSARSAQYTFAVTWTGEKSAQGTYFSRRDNAERLWKKRQRIGGASAKNPDISENGNALAVVWDEYEGDLRLVKTMLSANAGETWGGVRTLSTKNAAASLARIVPDGETFRVFWSESKDNNWVLRSTKL